jgi:hypothetical protein
MEKMGWNEEEEDEDEEVTTREPLTQEQHDEIKSYTGLKGYGYRGIRDETSRYFGVRYQYDEETGKPIKQFVPTTVDGNIVGYRTRVFPKDFSNPIGVVGKECDMIGQFRFKSARRDCIIVGGETKLLNTYQMLKDYNEQRGKDYDPPAVVCSTLGESGAWKQVQAQYEFFNQFERVIVCMDQDEAGHEATEKICKVLPKGKAHVMTMRYKDADDYVVDKSGAPLGREKEFINDYWGSKPYTPAGIVGSGDLSARMRLEVSVPKVTFPVFMREANEMTAGGMTLSSIVNIGAASGLGKTTWVDEIVEHLAFNSPHLVGVVSMEATAGQYGISMLSRYIRYNINSIQDPAEKQKFLEQDWVKAKEKELFFREDGSHRFYLVDDRDGTLDDLKAVVEQLVVQCNVKVIVLDPLQDILDGLSIDEQAVFLKWQKSLNKSHGVLFININHVRKSQGGGQQNSSGAMISEEDFQGSSTIFKSASLNILLVRDKMAEDPIERNTTKAYISKNRMNGITGPAGEYYYENSEKKMYHKADWMAQHGPKDF